MKTFFPSFLFILTLLLSPVSFAEPVGITPELSSVEVVPGWYAELGSTWTDNGQVM
jgi:hypothetical protein